MALVLIKHKHKRNKRSKPVLINSLIIPIAALQPLMTLPQIIAIFANKKEIRDTCQRVTYANNRKIKCFSKTYESVDISKQIIARLDTPWIKAKNGGKFNVQQGNSIEQQSKTTMHQTTTETHEMIRQMDTEVPWELNTTLINFNSATSWD